MRLLSLEALGPYVPSAPSLHGSGLWRTLSTLFCMKQHRRLTNVCYFPKIHAQKILLQYGDRFLSLKLSKLPLISHFLLCAVLLLEKWFYSSCEKVRAKLRDVGAVAVPRRDWGTCPPPLLGKINFLIRPNSMRKCKGWVEGFLARFLNGCGNRFAS